MVKVSVIVPVYNVGKYLRKCLDSMINQTLKDIEIICVNDGSTDDSLDILKDYEKCDNRVKVFSQKNLGQSASRNKGMDLANGEYLTFLDSDDWMELDALEKIYENAKSNNSDLVLFNAVEHRKNNKFHERRYLAVEDKTDYDDFIFDYNYDKRLVMNSVFVVWSKLYKTSFIKDFNLNFIEKFKIFEDVPFHIQSMLLAKRISYVPEVLYNYNRLNLHSNQTEKTTFNNRLLLFDIFDVVEEFLFVHDYYDEFKLNFIEFKLLQSLENLNRTQIIFKLEFYAKMREEFFKMRLEGNILKKLPFNLYRLYVLVINCQSFEQFEKFNNNVISHFKFINKKELSSKIDNFDEMGINSTEDSPKLIVSLTSFPQRMYDLHFCLYSLLTQSFKPNKLVLWLAEEQFPNKEDDIPQNVLNLKENGLTIKWCRDLSSYKKLIPSLEEYPNDYIVTADDDIFYPKDWLENIWKAHEKYPDSIISTRSRRIVFDENGNIDNYTKWLVSDKKRDPSYLNFATNGGGTLFFPNALFKDVLNEDLFLELCPSGDDIWFWTMMVLNKTKIYSIDKPMNDICYVNIARELNILDEITLWNLNKKGENDIQLERILLKYPAILDIIKK